MHALARLASQCTTWFGVLSEQFFGFVSRLWEYAGFDRFNQRIYTWLDVVRRVTTV